MDRSIRTLFYPEALFSDNTACWKSDTNIISMKDIEIMQHFHISLITVLSHRGNVPGLIRATQCCLWNIRKK